MPIKPSSGVLACTAIVASLVLVVACGGSDDEVSTSVPPVTITSAGANPVSAWNETASATINQPASAGGTPEEARPNYAVDLATVHVAIYDAVMAIAKTHQPYAIVPVSAADGASQEAATAAAAYGVLKGLYPSRIATYQALYDSSVAAIADGTARRAAWRSAARWRTRSSHCAPTTGDRSRIRRSFPALRPGSSAPRPIRPDASSRPSVRS